MEIVKKYPIITIQEATCDWTAKVFLHQHTVRLVMRFFLWPPQNTSLSLETVSYFSFVFDKAAVCRQGRAEGVLLRNLPRVLRKFTRASHAEKVSAPGISYKKDYVTP